MANQNSERLIEKANSLTSLAKAWSMTSLLTITDKFPQLCDATNIKEWIFLTTTLSVYSAVWKAKIDIVDKSLVDEIQQIAFHNLTQLDAQAIGLLKDVDEFLNGCIKKKGDDVTIEYIQYSAGMWLLINLTNNQTIEEEKLICSSLGALFFITFMSYWKEA